MSLTSKKIGVLFVNLGTPKEISKQAITDYLNAFLLDRHVVDLPRFLWSPLLNRIIIPKRLNTISAHYQSIWKGDRSPLLFYTESLIETMIKHSSLPENTHLAFAMTYGEPSIASALQALSYCDEIILLPLYPHYSTTTTLPIMDQTQKFLNANPEFSPRIQWIADYYNHPAYIHAIVQSLIRHFETAPFTQHLVLSYHGIPMRYIKKRHDPYMQQCLETTQLIESALKSLDTPLTLHSSFQSQFGKGAWTQPSTASVLRSLGEKHESVTVICPGFSMDCLETLYEIDMENRALYQQAGGTQFEYVPALNDSQAQIDLILALLADSTRFQPLKAK